MGNTCSSWAPASILRQLPNDSLSVDIKSELNDDESVSVQRSFSNNAVSVHGSVRNESVSMQGSFTYGSSSIPKTVRYEASRLSG